MKDMIEILEFLQENWDNYLGDCTTLNRYLKKRAKYSKIWSIVKFADTFFRSLGETVFVNNPFLGLLILIAIFIGHTKAGIGCVVGGLIATLTDYSLGLHPPYMVDNGVSSFNGSLLGTVLPALFSLVSDNEVHLWVAVCFGSFASVIVSSALMNSISKLHVPFMTLPFNFIAIISFLNFQSEEYFSHLDASISIKSNNTSTDIDWIRVVEGMVVSMGQVYAVGGLPTSIIMWVAVALYSPLLAVLSALGALIGTFLPLLFLDPDSYDSVYNGLWGYSCILSIAAVSWACFKISWKTILAGVINVLFTVFVQKSLLVTMSKARLPVFTLPFTLSTLIMVLCWEGQGQGLKKQKKSFVLELLKPFKEKEPEPEPEEVLNQKLYQLAMFKAQQRQNVQ